MAELSTNALYEIYESGELLNAVIEPCACGAPRVLSLGLDTFICQDRNCPYRAAARLFAIACKYDMERELPLSDLEFVCRDRYYRSWLDFFTDEWDDSDFETEHTKLVELIRAESDVSSLAILSGFDVLAEEQVFSLCGDFQSVTDLSDTLDIGGLQVVTEKLGLNEAHLLPVAVHIYNKLIECIGEMLEAEEIFR